MKYERTESFLRDYRGLPKGHRMLFRKAVREINEAYATRGKRRVPKWPSHLRIRDIEAAPGIWEMTWSFAGPDGRATFEYFQVGQELGIRWRRIGRHDILRRP